MLTRSTVPTQPLILTPLLLLSSQTTIRTQLSFQIRLRPISGIRVWTIARRRSPGIRGRVSLLVVVETPFAFTLTASTRVVVVAAVVVGRPGFRTGVRRAGTSVGTGTRGGLVFVGSVGLLRAVLLLLDTGAEAMSWGWSRVPALFCLTFPVSLVDGHYRRHELLEGVILLVVGQFVLDPLGESL